MKVFQGKEFLILADAADLLLQIHQCLGAEGARVTDAASAQGGLATALDILPHGIVVDLNLTGAGAFLFLAELKKAPQLKKVPVLVLGRAREPELIAMAIRLEASEHLLKPFTTSGLMDKLLPFIEENPYLPRKFLRADRPKIDMAVPAEIVSVDEGGFMVQAPVMLKCDSVVSLDAPFMEQVGCRDATTKSATRRPRSVSQGGYINEIDLLGIGAETAKAIREFQREAAAKIKKK